MDLTFRATGIVPLVVDFVTAIFAVLRSGGFHFHLFAIDMFY